MKLISKIIEEVLGEQNLYKIDRWKYPDKVCKHYNLYFCHKCKKEIENEE